MSKKWVQKMLAGPEMTGAYEGAATGWQGKKRPRDLIEQALRESQPPSRVRTVGGFQLLMTKEGGRWRYSPHGETGLRVRKLQADGHGRALEKALK